MSYILDALKKAESERHLGGVPSIHAGAPVAAVTDDTPAWRKNLPWLLVALFALVLLAYVLWSHPWSGTLAESAVHVAARPATETTPIQQNATPAPAPVSAPVPVNAPVAVAPPPPTRETPWPAPAAARPAPVAAEKPAPTEKPQPEMAVKPAVVETPVVPQDDEVGSLQSLPQSIQREVPQISVNGYIYARNPADRTVLINKRLMHEGESIAPDLVLEKMTPKGAILNYKGYRFRVAY